MAWGLGIRLFILIVEEAELADTGFVLLAPSGKYSLPFGIADYHHLLGEDDAESSITVGSNTHERVLEPRHDVPRL